MEHTSLYRKYRPSSFDAMIGQQHIRQTLKNAIRSQSIAHAYLFTGTRGTGKTSTAKIFARAINCLNPKEDGSPCNECEICKALASQNNLDIIELDAASNNSIDDIRSLIEKVNYRPSVGKYKVYIVDEVHMLTKQAFNAFLKTLEEPPEHVVFILATTEVQVIPSTILSRCMRFDFRLISKEELTNHIMSIFNDMGISYSNEACYAIAEAGNGSVRDALSVADMVISYCGRKKIEYADVLEVLGASSPEIIIELAEYILQGKVDMALSLANSIINKGKSINVLADDLAKMFNNIMYAKNCRDANSSLLLPNELFDAVSKASLGVSNFKIYRASEIFTELQTKLRYSSVAKVVLEIAIAKAADVAVSVDTDSLIQRVKDLEGFRRTIQGASLKEGTQLTPTKILGHLLNELNNYTQYRVENIVARKIKLEEVEIKDRVCLFNLTSKAVFDEVKIYEDVYKRVIKNEFTEIKELQINYTPTVAQQNKEEFNKLFANKEN